MLMVQIELSKAIIEPAFSLIRYGIPYLNQHLDQRHKAPLPAAGNPAQHAGDLDIAQLAQDTRAMAHITRKQTGGTNDDLATLCLVPAAMAGRSRTVRDHGLEAVERPHMIDVRRRG